MEKLRKSSLKGVYKMRRVQVYSDYGHNKDDERYVGSFHKWVIISDAEHRDSLFAVVESNDGVIDLIGYEFIRFFGGTF